MMITKHVISRQLSVLDDVGQRLHYINSLMQFLDKKRNLVMSKANGQFVEVLNTPEETHAGDIQRDEKNNEQQEK